jgi:tetratricopeptide (TPR) repeat protein
LSDEVPTPSLDDTLPAQVTPAQEGPGAAEPHGFAEADPALYEVSGELARGGMGRILSARDSRLGRPVAVKQLLVTSPHLRRRFEREIRITARLQHPGIVTVLEAGTWPGSGPFYAMPLVPGQSLDVAIARQATYAARLSLLPNVIAAVDALAYAHGQGIIHRDLKPSNVLVGEFGETVVIDWGLAKTLAELDEPRAADSGELSDAQATLPGSVVGTPAYMSPEQASGAVLDARADVYALGAMLYHLLVGAPPYVGEARAVLAAVVSGSPPSVASRVPGVAGDLLAIVGKAMARSPGERYPTARELGEDLKRFQTGQLVGAREYTTGELVRRWARRQQRVLAVSALALLALSVGGVMSVQRIVHEQARTEAQRVVAERHRVAAEDLMDFMLVDLRKKLEPVGKLELLDAVASKAVRYYAERPETAGREDDLRRARALENLGDVLAPRGDLAGALAQYEAARALAEHLVREAPTEPAGLNLLSRILQELASLAQEQGNHAAARALYQRELEVASTPETMSTPEGRELLASAHVGLGEDLESAGDLDGALLKFRQALQLDEETFSQGTPQDETLRALVLDHERIGTLLLDQGKLTEALAEYRAQLALVERQVAAAPEDVSYQRGLSVAHERVGNVLLEQEDLAGGFAERQASLVIDERLAARDPSNLDLQLDLTISREKLGAILGDQHRTAEAFRTLQEVVVARERLAASNPDNARIVMGLFTVHRRLGGLLSEQGRLDAALREWQAAKAAAVWLVDRDPTSAQWQGVLAEATRGVAGLWGAMKRFAPAEEALRASGAVWQKLLTAEPANHQYQQRLAITLTDLGEAIELSGRPTLALAPYREALQVAEQAAAGSSDPADAEHLARVKKALAACTARALKH